jgi:spore photoproduct lyase
MYQTRLFNDNLHSFSLPAEYEPVRSDFFDVSQIYLAKGSVSTPERRNFVERICRLYPSAQIKECLQTSHNHIELNEADPLALHMLGKKTLVFGELISAVRFSNEMGNACPNYWHFSPYGFCPYGCKYCYLAGTQGVKLSPTVKVFVNLPEMLTQIDRVARQFSKPTAFYVGKLQDGLALDPLTAYSTVLVPFFAAHPLARMTLLTKGTNVERLINIPHNGNIFLAWSLNPPEVCTDYEENVPDVWDRIAAMKRIAEAGYRIRAVIMPVIPIEGWETIYPTFIEKLVQMAPIERLTVGGICVYNAARKLMERKIGDGNIISRNIEFTLNRIGDGRARYPEQLRKKVYTTIINTVKRLRPEIEVGLCLEDHKMWQEVGLGKYIGHCNCVW